MSKPGRQAPFIIKSARESAACHQALTQRGADVFTDVNERRCAVSATDRVSYLVPRATSPIVTVNETANNDGTMPGPRGETEMVPIAFLLPSDSPRLKGENPDHIRRLADSEAAMPPILVHRQTMRVIDGMHRLRAAELRNQQKIAVRYFNGTELGAFVRAVQLNVTHGLPLTHADRQAAAVRIMTAYPSWADRLVASVTGLSAPLISDLRARSAGHVSPLKARIGRDGRVRPLSTAEGRVKASEIISARPDVSLRVIAKEAGISVGTARDVRERLRRGEDPLPPRYSRESNSSGSREKTALEPAQSAAITYAIDEKFMAALDLLRRDPSVRFTDSGRLLLRWLSLHIMSSDNRAKFIDSLPPHCKDRIAYMARCCGQWWRQLADDLASDSAAHELAGLSKGRTADSNGG